MTAISGSINKGFTLIEVLLALAVIAIALTALLKATSQDVKFTHRIKEKTIGHWVAMEGISAIQLGIVDVQPGLPDTHITTLLDERWYWKAELSPTPIKNTQRIRVTVSPTQTGPFSDEVIAYRYTP